MRQAGVLAACGIVSLTTMVERLADDHRRAKVLAERLSGLPGLGVDVDAVQTNMVLVETSESADDWQARLEEAGVWCFSVAPNRLRLVLHADVDDAMVERAAEAFAQLANRAGAPTVA